MAYISKAWNELTAGEKNQAMQSALSSRQLTGLIEEAKKQLSNTNLEPEIQAVVREALDSFAYSSRDKQQLAWAVLNQGRY